MAKLDVREVASGIWRVRRGRGGSAIYAIKMSPGAVLVDAGPDETGADVMRGLQVVRVGLNSVTAILLTHTHPHAASGARSLRERSGAKVLSPGEDGAATVSGWRRWLRRGYEPIEPDGRLEPGEVVQKYFEVIATPGHTAFHVSLLFRPTRTLFAGDALRWNGRAVGLPRGTENRGTAQESMKACLLAGPSLVLPAHGPALRVEPDGVFSALPER